MNFRAISPLWTLNMLLQMTVLGLMLWRGWYRLFRTFFVYICFGTCQTLVLMAVHTNYRVYFWTYWTTEAAVAILMTAALQDLFVRLLPEDGLVRKISIGVFFGCCALFLVAAVLTFSWNREWTGTAIVQAVLSMERGLHILQSGLIVCSIVALMILGNRWGSMTARTFLGLAIVTAVKLLLVSVLIDAGESAKSSFFWLKPTTYTFAFAFWAWTFARSAPDVTQPVKANIQTMLERLEETQGR